MKSRTQKHKRNRFVFRPLALAAMAALTWPALPALATISSTGSIFTSPEVVDPLGPDIGANSLWVGFGAPGSFSVTAGSQYSAAAMLFGGGGTGSGTGLFDGASTTVTLNGDGNNNRFDVGNWGTGSVTVSGGATLDARANASACLTGNQWCGNFIGNAAGSDATFTVTGTGSNASFLRWFVVGGVGVFDGFGTPGGTTTGRVNVLDGGTLTTDTFTLGAAPNVGTGATGTEVSNAIVVIDGGGSLWRVTGDSFNTSAGVYATTGSGANATATIDITGGGKMLIEGRDGVSNVLDLSNGGGTTYMTISGAGSSLEFTGDAGLLRVGRVSGSAELNVLNGGKVSGMQLLNVGGRETAPAGTSPVVGVVRVDGAGSEVLVNGTTSAAANLAGGGGADAAPAYMIVGRGGGAGIVDVANGGRITIEGGNTATPNRSGIELARDATSLGLLQISGPGSVVSVSQGAFAGVFNPLVRIGRDGTGSLIITDGGKLLIDGQALSPGTTNQTLLFIGGSGGTTVGGNGVATVSGAESEIRMTGNDTFLVVGQGPQSTGSLDVNNGASVSALGLLVGNSGFTDGSTVGGFGVVNVDNARINLSGQASDASSAAALTIGRGGGAGVVNITNNSTVTISNTGSVVTGLFMGGTSGGPTGNGTLNVTDSTINVIAPTAVARIGFNGTAQATLTNSTLNVGGGAVTIASQPGSTGTLTLNAGSVINTTYVGVGTPSQGVLTGGGNGTLIVRAGATVNGDSPQAVFELGATSLLKGTGELNFREGNVIIGGTVDPGDSPGRLRINCNLVSLDGSRLILEVQSSGTGYNVDQLVIGDDSTFDLKQFQIAFTFLDATDPTAFAASGGFDLDNFLKAGRFDANGNSLPASSDDPLSAIFAAGQTWADVVDGTKITAVSSAFNITSLSLDGATGSFNVAVAPIPEPSTWALMLAGLVIIGARAKRQRRDSSALLPRGPAIACS